MFCLVGQNMFLSLCWLLICEDDIYWMSHNPKHTITCGSNADIPLLLMGRTLWQRVIYSNWNLNHFFPQARHPVWWWININRSAERGFCLSKPLTRYLRKTLFVKWGICTLLHFVCIPIPCVLYFLSFTIHLLSTRSLPKLDQRNKCREILQQYLSQLCTCCVGPFAQRHRPHLKMSIVILISKTKYWVIHNVAT